ncbi:conjugal transfer protein [Streptacidiphilus neutrinimicus]|uniref:conjugal transfer protein n=1 Tax=Streptacidiphilus neutrinimicus TaxID=105420 RepID=UPI0006937A8A|nr:conjugal transfer protein [Streptacidiphilus neutrinimicus]
MSRSPAQPVDDFPEDVVDDIDSGRAWRQGRARRAAVWAALAAGPLALFASCASTRVPAHTSTRAAASAAAPVAAQDPSGFAQLFVSLWLRTDSSADDAHLAALRGFAPNVELRTAQGTGSAMSVAQCASVRSTRLRSGYWSVVVGCETDIGGQAAMRYFAVPVEMDQSAAGVGSLAVVTQPAAVAAPAPAGVPQTLYPADAAAGTPLASSVSAFMTAYLTGQGDVTALLSPGARVPAPASALYGQVQVGQVAVGQPGMDAPVPADGTTCQVWVQVTATDQNGTAWPLGYALRMRARAGRWEVAALEAGPALSVQVAPVTSASASAGSASPTATAQ